MLLEISLENFVLIKHLHLSFAPGLTVVTGETGAGKSLLIQALKIILGAKAAPQHIRTGEEQAVIQAVFETPKGYGVILDRYGIPEDDVIIIRRNLTINGRTKNYINGAMVNLQTLREIAAPIASLGGQHEFQGLLSTANHCVWLDRFGDLEPYVSEVSNLHQALLSAKKAFDMALKEKKATEETVSRLERELQEIASVAPVHGEDETLDQELKVLKEAANLKAIGESCYNELYIQKGSLLEGLARCKAALERMSAVDQRVKKADQEFASVIYQAEETAFFLRDYLKDLPSDISRLDEVEERIHRLRELKRRFGPELSDVLSYKTKIEKRLDETKNLDGTIEDLEKEISKKENELLASALRLSKKRKEAAMRLSRAVEAGLKELNFSRSAFLAEVTGPEHPKAEDVSPNGLDEVRFIFSPNIGEPPRPIEEIASGGELSRVTLALRAALAEKFGIETIIFDEIDAGLGGETAGCVGQKLKALADRGQVIAVTHFPQIAVLADHHVVVTKTVEEGKTLTKIKNLTASERMDEIARMLGGDQATAKRYAKELL
ncbi:MAG: DNA repair protein RecN, partial [Dissulfurimicrobium sp.]